jgi:hypothetical protein
MSKYVKQKLLHLNFEFETKNLPLAPYLVTQLLL